MAANSLYKLTLVLPVPVTEFSQTTDTDMSTSAIETMRNTGIPASINAGPCP